MFKKSKRLTAIAMSAVMMISLGACGNKNESASVAEETESAAQTASETAPGGITMPDKPEVDMTLNTGDVILDLNFDDGSLGNFKTFTSGGNVSIAVSDKQLKCDIKTIGNLDYSNQVFYDGFALAYSCIYTYSFDIYSDIDRKIEYRLQKNGGDYHAYQGDYIDIGPDVLHFSVDFEMQEASDPAPRLVFNMGLMSDMTADPGEHSVYIDNIKLVVKDAGNAEAVKGVPDAPIMNASQIGYYPDDVKTVTISGGGATEFEVVNADTEEVVYTGKFGEEFKETAIKNQAQYGDFTEVKEPGTYYIRSGSVTTYPFVIGDGIYDDIYKDVVLMLYKQRCGCEVDESIAGEGFGHDVCHTQTTYIYGTDETIDVSGGWHDAGDYGRYVVAGAMTIQDLLLAYEKYDIKRDDLGIPESGNGIPDLLDEAKWELDWMLKMQTADGSVYHKVTCLDFPGMTVTAPEETEDLYVAPVSTAATADFAAVMAKASVVYAAYDSAFASECLNAAKAAFDYVEGSDDTKGFKNPTDITTGEYSDKNTNDEIFWAAVELYLVQQDERYAKEINARLETELAPGLGWADVAGYGMYDLVAASPEGLTDAVNTSMEALIKEANRIIKSADMDAYFMAFGDKYVWGSNLQVGANGDVLMMAYEFTGDGNYKVYAKRQLDYIFGYNALGYCFVSGYGTVCPENPHHRPSQAAGKAMSGMLAGGPDSSLEDNYAKAILNGMPPAMCYVDNDQSYSTNEVTIYWNSPLILLMSAFV